MVVHGEIADPDPDPLPGPHHERVDGGKNLAVEGPQIKVGHDCRVRPVGTRVHHPVVQQEGEIPVDGLGFAVLRMNDEQAHHPDGHLHHLVSMRVVHVGAMLTQRELVGVGLSRLDVRLAQAADAVHPARQQNAVPVNGGVLGEFVRHQDPDSVALDRFDGRARCAAVVAPGFHGRAGRELVFNLFGGQVKFLDAILERVG